MVSDVLNGKTLVAKLDIDAMNQQRRIAKENDAIELMLRQTFRNKVTASKVPSSSGAS